MKAFRENWFSHIRINNVSSLKAFIIPILLICLLALISIERKSPAPPYPINYSVMPGTTEIIFVSSTCEPNGEILIGNQFISRETTCIYFKIDQDRTNYRKPYDYLLHLELYKDTGEIFLDYEEEQHIEAIWPQFTTSLRVGIDVPGYWKPGNYFAYISIDEKLYAAGGYEIVGPQ
jgi:hypothetical protein